MPKVGYYAVKIGKRPGIYTTWEDCREQVDGYPRARYKKLRSVKEAEAWMQGASSPVKQHEVPYPVKPKLRPASHSLGQARTLIGPQPSRQASASSTVESLPTVPSGSESQRSTGLSSARSRDETGQSQASSSPPPAMVEAVVYTDGACSGNGQSGSIAGIGVWWGPNDARNFSERCPGRQTNNRAELIAIIRALETTPINSVPLVIKSDSEYAIKCFTDWLPTWRRSNFITSQGTPVKNVKLIMYMDALFAVRERSGQDVRLKHVRGHAGEVGNEGADALAVHGVKLPEIDEPDWDALRLQLERKPVSVESADASMYAEMVLDEGGLLAELDAA
ncbi:ribonuclease H-like domain-containing protein [Russula dissimulans]|nr:ribonuclease H-like domain-containing protein [Russula dissimulans]